MMDERHGADPGAKPANITASDAPQWLIARR